MTEIKKSASDAMDVLVTVAARQIKGDGEQLIAPMCTAYG